MAVSKSKTIVVWVLSILVALAFLAAGGSKLAGAAAMVAVFEKVGVGQWFRYVTGGLEVAAAIALFIPRLRFYGAALLVAIMAGAVASHLTVLGGSPAAPLVLGVLSGVIAWLSKAE